MAGTRPVALTPAQRAALREALRRTPRPWRGMRDRAMALLVLSARLRPAEVAGWRIDQARAFSEDRWDPAGRARRAPLAREALAAWLGCRAVACMPGNWAFTRTEWGTPCSPQDVYRALRRVLRQAGVDPGQVGRLDVSTCVRRTSSQGRRHGRVTGARRIAASDL
jgi:integrase